MSAVLLVSGVARKKDLAELRAQIAAGVLPILGHRYRIVHDAGSDTDRGETLRAAYAAAVSPPEGERLTLLTIGVSDLGTAPLALTKPRIDIVGLVPAKVEHPGRANMALSCAAKITSAGPATVTQTANDVLLSDIELANTMEVSEPEYNAADPAVYWPNSGVAGTVLRRVRIAGSDGSAPTAWATRLGIAYTQTFEQCWISGTGSVGGLGGTMGGTISNSTIGGTGSVGGSGGTMSGVAENTTVSGSDAFGLITGLLLNVRYDHEFPVGNLSGAGRIRLCLDMHRNIINANPA